MMLLLSSLAFAAVAGQIIYPKSTRPTLDDYHKHQWPKLCTTGKAQSPIDIDGTTVHREPLRLEYDHPVALTSHGGMNMQIILDGVPKSEKPLAFIPPGQSKKFYLKQFHLHTMSEHTVNGVSFPIEVHFVHIADDNTIAVIAVFMKFGKESAAYETMLSNFNLEVHRVARTQQEHATTKHKDAVEEEASHAIENPIDVFAGSPLDRYWTYTGSLTTPPCSEGVLWHVLEIPGTLSKTQYNLMLKLRGTDAYSNRRVNPLNGRMVDNGSGPRGENYQHVPTIQSIVASMTGIESQMSRMIHQVQEELKVVQQSISGNRRSAETIDEKAAGRPNAAPTLHTNVDHDSELVFEGENVFNN